MDKTDPITKNYNLTILVPLGTLFAVFISLALWVEPITGDLTRLGGFTENNFGWNDPQQQFPSILFKLEEAQEYDQYHDVVVLGDSFSEAYPKTQWQNYFVQATGLSLITYKVDEIDIESFIASPAYQDHPPRIVIYETVERSLVDRVAKWNKGDCQSAVPTPSPRPPIKIEPGNQVLSSHFRNIQNGPLHPNFSSGVHFLKRLIKKTFSKKSNQAIKITLNRSDLFSNRESGHLLVYRNDFKKYQVSKESLNGAICGLSYIQDTFQKNGETFFVGMIAPDKLTAYIDVYKNFNREKINWIEEISKHRELHIPRLDVALKNAISRGTQDVYLPNDTHWGSAGQRIAALTLVEYLTKENTLSAHP